MTHVFVGGAQRSGTTLLTRLLCAGPETNQHFAECSGLRSLLESFELMRKRFDDETVHHLGSRAVLNGFFAATVQSFFKLVLAQHAPATRLVLKEPHMTQYFTHLYHLVPDCHFVVIKRDPRDVVVSMLDVGKKLADRGHAHIYNTADIGKVARQVALYYQAVFEGSRVNPSFADAVTWVRYETLVTDPAKVLDDVRAGTGLSLAGVDPYNPVKQPAAEVQPSARQEPWVTGVEAKGVVSGDRVGRYRTRLTADELAAVEMATCHLIHRFGYAFETEAAEKAALAAAPKA